MIDTWRNRLAMRLLRAAIGRPTPPPPPPDWSARPYRVLYLRYDKIGDMILATGIIRAIARSHPTLTVDVLASRRNAPVLEGDPYVGTVILFEKKKPWTYLRTFRAVRRAHYDTVIDTKVSAPSFTDMVLMMLSGAPHRIGTAGRETSFALTLQVPPLTGAAHYVDHSAALLSAFGLDATQTAVDLRPEIALSDVERTWGETQWRPHAAGLRLLVNISAGDDSRSWPVDRFISVLTTLRARVAPEILVVSYPGDRGRAERIAAAIEGHVAPTPSVRHVFALVAASDAVLTPDTSITHAASAFSIPAVVMFPRGRGALYGPYRTRGRAVSTPAPTIRGLAVEPVLDALTSVIAAQTADRFEAWPSSPLSMPRRSLPSAEMGVSPSEATAR
jgi:ADP-heptose:LPS heptosyltransferase